MVDDNCPDMVGMFSEDQIAFDGCDILHKDRSDTQKKAGRGVVLDFRKTIICGRRHGIETLQIETLWA